MDAGRVTAAHAAEPAHDDVVAQLVEPVIPDGA